MIKTLYYVNLECKKTMELLRYSDRTTYDYLWGIASIALDGDCGCKEGKGIIVGKSYINSIISKDLIYGNGN